MTRPLIELVNVDLTRRQRKIVQLYIYGAPVLLADQLSHTNRTDFLASYLRYKGIPFELESTKNLETGQEEKIIKRQNTDQTYVIAGMGTLSLYPDQKVYNGIISRSHTYNLGRDNDHGTLVAQWFRENNWKILYGKISKDDLVLISVPQGIPRTGTRA